MPFPFHTVIPAANGILFVFVGLAYVSLCSVETVYILSIVDEADAGYPVVNVTFATKKSIESEDFMSPEFLKERLYLQREIFYNMTSVEVSIVGFLLPG